MNYHIITFGDGTEEKILVEKATKNQILDHCKQIGKEVLSIRQAVIDVEEKKQSKSISYEVRLSFNEDGQNVTITKDELPMVMWAFLKDAKVVCKNGAFRGKDIISVLPNFNAIMGWNKGYELTPEDFASVSRNEVCLEARNYQNSIKNLCYECSTSQELLEKSSQLKLN